MRVEMGSGEKSKIFTSEMGSRRKEFDEVLVIILYQSSLSGTSLKLHIESESC